MAEAPSSQLHISNNNTTGIALQNHHGGDHDKIEMVKLEVDGGGDSVLVEDRFSDGVYDKPLSCFGCGIGWFSFLLGFTFPPLWFYATVLYFGNYLKDPRERPGLAASAIAALICSVSLVVLLVSLLPWQLSLFAKCTEYQPLIVELGMNLVRNVIDFDIYLNSKGKDLTVMACPDLF